jgi:chromosomal replication initiator protein
LADRLLGGGIWPLDPLDRDTRLAILRAKIARLDCPLPEDAVNYLADNLHGNARELEGALHSVRHYAEVNGLPLTLPVVREATGQLVRFTLRAVQIKDVEKAVCQLLELDAKALRSNTRARSISYPRMIAMYLARQHAGASFTEIGRYFGGRNHSTAVAADKKVRHWLTKDETLFIGDRRWKAKELIAAAERELTQ